MRPRRAGRGDGRDDCMTQSDPMKRDEIAVAAAAAAGGECEIH